MLTSSWVLSNQALIQLSHLRPNNASVLARTLVHQSTEAHARADEVAAVIQDAAAAFRAQSRSPTKGPSKILTPRAPLKASSAAVPAKKPAKAAPVIDVWSNITETATAPSSSLFGSTLGKKASSPAKAKQSSSLFGNTLKAPKRPSRKGSPGFSAVQSSIFSELAPAAPKVEVEAPGSSLPAPETVPFVPAANRKNATSDHTPIVAATQPAETTAEVEVTTSGAPRAAVDNDGIVSVKKKKAKKPKKASPSPAAESAEPAKAEKKPAKKQKVQAGDIPTFSYENEANLLDEPAKAATNQRKAKKAKRDTKGDSKKKTGEFLDTGKQLTMFQALIRRRSVGPRPTQRHPRVGTGRERSCNAVDCRHCNTHIHRNETSLAASHRSIDADESCIIHSSDSSSGGRGTCIAYPYPTFVFPKGDGGTGHESRRLRGSASDN